MSDTAKFEVIYYKQPRFEGVSESHRYTEDWDRTEFYCIQCGKQGLWQSSDEDYDAGPSLMCEHCGYSFTFNYFYEAKEHVGLINNQEWQRLVALRSASAKD